MYVFCSLPTQTCDRQHKNLFNINKDYSSRSTTISSFISAHSSSLSLAFFGLSVCVLEYLHFVSIDKHLSCLMRLKKFEYLRFEFLFVSFCPYQKFVRSPFSWSPDRNWSKPHRFVMGKMSACIFKLTFRSTREKKCSE